jgi:hypothetical protein
LVVDGEFLFKAEAQDSRSAVANKEAASEKLHTVQRKHWNDRVQRLDVNRLLQSMHDGCAQTVAASYGEENLGLVAAAIADGAIPAPYAAVVYAVEAIRHAVGGDVAAPESHDTR